MTQENLTEEQQEFEKKRSQVIELLNNYKGKYPSQQTNIEGLIKNFQAMQYHNVNYIILNFFLKNNHINNEEEIKEEKIKMMIVYCTDLINYRVSFSDDLIKIINEQFNVTLAEYKKINDNLKKIKQKLGMKLIKRSNFMIF